MLSLFFSIIVAFPFLAWSATPPCEEKLESHGPLVYSRQLFSETSCFLFVRPKNSPELIYRSLILRETGKLLVFNSYGSGPSETDTGARVYYFFPRKINPNFSLSENKVRVHVSDGLFKIIFDAESGRLLSAEGARISQDPKIYPENKGGIEISSFRGLMLDSGFSMGSDPSADQSRESIFTDQMGRRCTVKNSEVFLIDSSGESTFKFTDKNLAKFISKRCPGLKFSL